MRVGRIGHNSSVSINLHNEGCGPASTTSISRFTRNLVYRLRLSILLSSLQKHSRPKLLFVLVIFVRVGRIGHNSSVSINLHNEGRDPASTTSISRFTRNLVYRLRLSILLSSLQKHSRPKLLFVLVIFVRVGRIELPSDPWQGPILPLNYTRDCHSIYYFKFQ